MKEQTKVVLKLMNFITDSVEVMVNPYNKEFPRSKLFQRKIERDMKTIKKYLLTLNNELERFDYEKLKKKKAEELKLKRTNK
jgi:hypothetical protein